ncbi:MAG: nuclear transport factor 2 family protein [Acidimicrobiales bacterium]
MDRPSGVVSRYFEALGRHDWEAFAATLAPEVIRIGPFHDVYTPRQRYVEFLVELMPALRGYRLEIHRMIEAGNIVTVQLSETVDGLVTPETLVFDVDGDGRIVRIDICIKIAPPTP